MNEIQHEIILFWDRIDKIFVAEIPELPGCMAHGETKIEALQNVEDAARVWVETAIEDGKQIPAPRGRLMFA